MKWANIAINHQFKSHQWVLKISRHLLPSSKQVSSSRSWSWAQARQRTRRVHSWITLRQALRTLKKNIIAPRVMNWTMVRPTKWSRSMAMESMFLVTYEKIKISLPFHQTCILSWSRRSKFHFLATVRREKSSINQISSNRSSNMCRAAHKKTQKATKRTTQIRKRWQMSEVMRNLSLQSNIKMNEVKNPETAADHSMKKMEMTRLAK